MREIKDQEHARPLDLTRFGGTRLVDFVFATGNQRPFAGEKVAKSVHLIRPRFVGLRPPSRDDHGEHPLYFNMGLEPHEWDFRIEGAIYDDVVATTCGEFKGFGDLVLDGGTVLPNCRIKQGWRIRHGHHALIRRWKGLTAVTLRGHDHVVEDCPDATVVLYAGNLPSRWEEWGKLHKPGGGSNMQCATDCYVAGVKAVLVGSPGGGFSSYKAARNVIHPDVRDVRLLAETGTRRAARDTGGGKPDRPDPDPDPEPDPQEPDMPLDDAEQKELNQLRRERVKLREMAREGLKRADAAENAAENAFARVREAKAASQAVNEFDEGGGGTDPGPVDPGPTDPGPVDPGPTDPGPVDLPPLPVEPVPAGKGYGRGVRSGLLVNMGLSSSPDGYRAYEQGTGCPVDVVACWARKGNEKMLHPDVIGGKFFENSPSWWAKAPAKTARVLMLGLVVGGPANWIKAANGEYDPLWNRHLDACEREIEKGDLPWIENRIEWEANGGWYPFAPRDEGELGWMVLAGERFGQLSKARNNHRLRVSIGFASPGNQRFQVKGRPFNNLDMLPGATSRLPNFKGGTTEVRRSISAISLSWYNKNSGQGGGGFATDMATFNQKAAYKWNGGPAAFGSWIKWCRENGWTVGVAETGNWGQDEPIWADGNLQLMAQNADIVNYFCTLNGGEHQQWPTGGHAGKTGARQNAIQKDILTPKRLQVAWEDAAAEAETAAMLARDETVLAA